MSCREDLVYFRGLGMSGCGVRLFQNPPFLLLFFAYGSIGFHSVCGIVVLSELLLKWCFGFVDC